MQKQLSPETMPMMHDEEILVVKRELIFQHDSSWYGLKQLNYDWYLWAIEHYGQFNSRSLMESDPRYKQIIPYLVFMNNDKVFVMQRKDTASEKRLASKLSVGIGGHIRKEDLLGTTIFDWARREFNEEVVYNDKFEFEPLGIVNDDSNSVGEVHLGFVFLLKGSTSNIKVKSELKSGEMISLESIKDLSKYETWSQLVLKALQ